MTTLTIEEQRKLTEKVPNAYRYPDLLSDDKSELCSALAVLEAYAKDGTTCRHGYIEDCAMGVKIIEALRAGDLDPIARELIGGK